jgi:mRNA (guanine-N7-)-methyltransferase
MSSNNSKRPRENDNDEASRPRKRPGGASRVSKAESEAVLLRQQQRAEVARKAASSRGVEEVVRQHYNAVPQRGREWRKTDSRIKGLRSFNNWVKSTLIHKFSPAESGSDTSSLRVLDIGCGKGGDLGKWQQAPQSLELYVGVDPAEVSIEQARERYAQMSSGGGRGGRGGGGGRGGYHGNRQQRTFHAEFFVDDAFLNSLGDISLIRNVGFGGGSRWGPGGGFDVVSMMFCMHYAFETEVKAKGMLQNVANSLKKGGRFIGVIPNSDVIRSGVEAFHERRANEIVQNDTKVKFEGKNGENTDGSESPPYMIGKEPTPPFAPESPPYIIGEQAEAASPKTPQTNGVERSKGSEAAPGVTSAINVLTEAAADVNGNDEKRDDVEAPNIQLKPGLETSKSHAPPPPPVAEWGNSIYRIRFPGETPKDGIFRPPYGWKYSFFMEEAVEEVPEYVVPWEAFRAYVFAFPLLLSRRLLTQV